MIRNLKDSGVTEELLTFLVVAVDHRHLGRTALRLGISEPKASRLLAKARTVFSDPLFERHGRGLLPTHRAITIAERAKPLLETFRSLCEESVFEPAKFDRVLHIACLDNAILIALEPIMAKLRTVAPRAGVAVSPHEESTIRRLREGDLDFAIFPAVDLPPDFESAPLLRTPYVHVVRRGHPLEALLDAPEELALALEREPRAQITVHPDTDSPAEGVPGPATIPLSTRETVFWSPYWIGSFFVAMRQNLVMTLPWRSARALSELVPLTVLAQAQPGLLLEPHLIWHRHIDKDPALSWARCMMLDTLHVQPGEEDAWRSGPLGGLRQA